MTRYQASSFLGAARSGHCGASSARSYGALHSVHSMPKHRGWVRWVSATHLVFTVGLSMEESKVTSCQELCLLWLTDPYLNALRKNTGAPPSGKRRCHHFDNHTQAPPYLQFLASTGDLGTYPLWILHFVNTVMNLMNLYVNEFTY